ncbi:MAG TPA: GRAM domain-containing protein [Patescibacteria group bacterium]|nr:GRAM domain-containing protein [Patescibacteria group bacterium]
MCVYSFPVEETENFMMKDFANYSCEDVHLSGALYLTERRLVFVGYALTLDDKFMEDIPLAQIKELRAEKTFYLIPNVISIVTAQNRRIRFVVKKRDQWLAKIQEQFGQQ